MTRSNILARPTSAERTRTRYFRKLVIMQKALLISYRFHFDLFRQIFMIQFIVTGFFAPAPAHHRTERMNQHSIEIRQANRLHQIREIHRIFSRRERNISIEVCCVRLPVGMKNNLR